MRLARNVYNIRRFAGDVHRFLIASALNHEVVFIESPNSWNRAFAAGTPPLLGPLCKPTRKARSVVSGAENDFKLLRGACIVERMAR
jgi:hypothetical protein